MFDVLRATLLARRGFRPMASSLQKAFQSHRNVFLQISEKELIIVQMIYAVGEQGIAVIDGGNVRHAQSSAVLVQICARQLCDLLLDLAGIFGISLF